MKKLIITRFAVVALAALISLPALAQRESQPREPGIVRILKLAKRALQIVTTGDYPTVPKP